MKRYQLSSIFLAMMAVSGYERTSAAGAPAPTMQRPSQAEIEALLSHRQLYDRVVLDVLSKPANANPEVLPVEPEVPPQLVPDMPPDPLFLQIAPENADTIDVMAFLQQKRLIEQGLLGTLNIDDDDPYLDPPPEAFVEIPEPDFAEWQRGPDELRVDLTRFLKQKHAIDQFLAQMSQANDDDPYPDPPEPMFIEFDEPEFVEWRPEGDDEYNVRFVGRGARYEQLLLNTMDRLVPDNTNEAVVLENYRVLRQQVGEQ